jgi:signal transduction histidine kinase
LTASRCIVDLIHRGDATGWWDRLRIEQILRNLLSNAIRFGAGRPIAIAVSGSDTHVTVEIRDHGIGIAPALQTRIFERFERAVAQRSGGFGVGLWVVKSLCSAMGGTVTVESELGEGACFRIMLPRRIEPAASDA